MSVIYHTSGINGNGLYYWDYATGQWYDISKTWNTTNGSYTISNLQGGSRYYLEMIWYTDATHSWTQQILGFDAVTSYKTPTLTGFSNKATSLTVNVTYPVTGINGNGLYYWDYATGQLYDISKTWNTTNGSYTVNDLKPNTRYMVKMIWYTDATHS